MSGKGDKPRPIPDRKRYEENWDKIFGKKKGDMANVGWVTDKNSLTSKIYQPDHFGYITTNITPKGKIQHYIEK